MVDLHRAPPNRGYPGWCPPLTWDGPLQPGNSVLVLLSCGNGHEGTLQTPTIHQIAADGTVTPSCVCPYKGCGWHEFVRLVGWMP